MDRAQLLKDPKTRLQVVRAIPNLVRDRRSAWPTVWRSLWHFVRTTGAAFGAGWALAWLMWR